MRRGMRELELIEALQGVLRREDPRVIRWLGDDAAITRSRGYAVTSVDTMVDGVHFRSSELSSAEIGHRALAGALSDLAAMGAAPGEAFLALGLPAGAELDSALALIGGAQQLAGRHGVSIAGGDVTRAPALTMSFTVIGWTRDPGELVTRDGAQPGDIVGVTGTLGGAGAGLAVVEGRVSLGDAHAAELRERYARPEPQLAAGAALAAAGASAMIDLSDGLATDAAHIARASGVALELSLAALPLAGGVRDAAAQLSIEAEVFAASAGDDYELCVCAPPPACATLAAALASAAPAARITWIGRAVRGTGVSFAGASAPLSGYEHLL